MNQRRSLAELFGAVIDEFNAQSYQGRKLSMRPDELLFGAGGVLDSLGLVNLVTMLEEHVEDEFGVTISLADERAMSRKSSPFRTIASLMTYVSERLEENQRD